MSANGHPERPPAHSAPGPSRRRCGGRCPTVAPLSKKLERRIPHWEDTRLKISLRSLSSIKKGVLHTYRCHDGATWLRRLGAVARAAFERADSPAGLRVGGGAARRGGVFRSPASVPVIWTRPAPELSPEGLPPVEHRPWAAHTPPFSSPSQGATPFGVEAAGESLFEDEAAGESVLRHELADIHDERDGSTSASLDIQPPMAARGVCIR